jgi:hypothetical protein
MIDFPCHCGDDISVPSDLAGGVFQCPRCGRLNDVPNLGELDSIDVDGAYKLDDAPAVGSNPERIASIARAFSQDQPGNTAYDLVSAPSAYGSQPPKYDPETGELIREIDFKPDDAPPRESIPVARAAYIPPPTSIDGMDVVQPYEAAGVPLRLLRTGNVLVMFFVVLGFAFGQALMVLIAFMNYIVLVFWFVMHASIVSHYANVIDETGPTSNHELPTPLRQLSWYDDTGGPFFRVILATLYCFGPALLMLMFNSGHPWSLPLLLALTLFGGFVFPAAVLTTTTSGTALNLRPDRVIAVISTIGLQYAAILFTFAVGFSCSIGGFIVLNWVARLTSPFTDAMTPAPYVNSILGYGLVIIGTYVLHLCCWLLGIAYRQHHSSFGWVMQRHTRRSEGFPVLRRSRSGRAVPVAKAHAGQ